MHPSIIRTTVLLAFTFFLAACSSLNTPLKTPLDEDYNFGDTTKQVLGIQETFCTSANPALRGAAYYKLKSMFPWYPQAGFCTNPLRLIDEVASRGGYPVEAPNDFTDEDEENVGTDAGENS